ncbi:hypothetical protein M231_02563 [Tremella mesenterica]|uniref:HAD hydrolase, family IA n=1 Tax=Tremella mesenterica TaxID=5217 RepID=A0A4Q1BQA7_TREME|nr:uncharacterized protein TREMEDRAFT_68219 [Tremella mesenterica DSM 1558]EIW70781.1 hypothetical protein TREMEDRAFT_68219 [Tremella mesenterica DSM 1558]RXK40106.1 hypothetical protein M231_02563 [Tremella mesenterica]
MARLEVGLGGQTGQTICDEANKQYGHNPTLTLDDFKYEYYCYNRGWSHLKETIKMFQELVQLGAYERCAPMPGALEALTKLQESHRLMIVTARSEADREVIQAWLDTHTPGIFEKVYFTSTFTNPEDPASLSKTTKAEVIQKIGAHVFVDDSPSNIVGALRANSSLMGLLFGEYTWNQAVWSTMSGGPPKGETDSEDIPYVDWTDDQIRDNEARRQEKIEADWLPNNAVRVKDWTAVLSWVEEWEKTRSAL